MCDFIIIPFYAYTKRKSATELPFSLWFKAWFCDLVFTLKKKNDSLKWNLILKIIHTFLNFGEEVVVDFLFQKDDIDMVSRLNLVVGFSDGCWSVKILQESDKGQIFSWSIQTCSRIRRLIDCHHAQKTSKLPYFRLFRPDNQILSALYCLILT